MTSYEPDDHVELVARIRDAMPPEVDIRIDAHGTWNDVEARRIMRALEPYRVSYIEQPIASLLPQALLCGRRRAASGRAAASSASTTSASSRSCGATRALPISCHWWTPPIVQPDGQSRARPTPGSSTGT